MLETMSSTLLLSYSQKAFLNYDFLEGPTKSEYLAVNEKGELYKVKWAALCWFDKMNLVLKGEMSLRKVAECVSKLTPSGEEGSSDYERWQLQIANLRQKVKKYNRNHYFKESIPFRNIWKSVLKIKLTYPKLPSILEKPPQTTRDITVEYSPYTTFTSIIKKLGKELEHWGSYIPDPKSDLKVILIRASRKERIYEWRKQSPGKSLRIAFLGLNLQKYLAATAVYSYKRGLYDGYMQSYRNQLWLNVNSMRYR